jgi:hypothetical protein
MKLILIALNSFVMGFADPKDLRNHDVYCQNCNSCREKNININYYIKDKLIQTEGMELFGYNYNQSFVNHNISNQSNESFVKENKNYKNYNEKQLMDKINGLKQNENRLYMPNELKIFQKWNLDLD